MTLVILSEGIDLSLGAILGLVGIVTTTLYQGGYGGVCSIFAGIGTACLLGLVNGLLISRANLPPFIVTFGTMGMAQSLALALSKGLSLSGLPNAIRFLGQGYFAYVPIPVWIAGISCILMYLLLSHTALGVHIYAVGASDESAVLRGIRIDQLKLFIYTIAALLCSIGGLVTIGRMNSAHPTVGIGMEFDAIAAVVIGGTSLFGGEGGVLRTVIGVLVISILSNGLNLMGISGAWQISITGVLILISVIGDVFVKRFEN
jgi:ribose transport system permease protein